MSRPPEFKSKKPVKLMTAPAPKLACIIGKYCEFHEYVHGAEAEELRSKLEKLVTKLHSDSCPESSNLGLAALVQHLLDDVDARDTCDFVQVKPRLGSSGAWRGKNEHAVRPRPKRKAKK